MRADPPPQGEGEVKRVGIVIARGEILPDGANQQIPVEPCAQKFSAFLSAQIIIMSRLSHPDEGRFAIVTDVGCGCGGREGAR